jgi:2-keto-4-pentenoate hydratase/2-oxohepta-3-ene-1,7-dioic acid hydratase in catechol pathway
VKPSPRNDLHHEVELTILIGQRGSRIPETEALSFVAGYGVGLDMTLRDVQAEAKQRGLPWSVAKGFDTSAPLSDFIPADTAPPWETLHVELRVNGEIRQQGSARDFLFTLPRLIAYASSVFTLERGDILFTGTPEGVGSVSAGDVLQGFLKQDDGQTLASMTVYAQ